MQLDIIIIILFRQPRLGARTAKAPSTRKEPWPSSAGSPFQAAYGPEDRAILPLWPLCMDTPEVPLLRGLSKETCWSDPPVSVFGPPPQAA